MLTYTTSHNSHNGAFRPPDDHAPQAQHPFTRARAALRRLERKLAALPLALLLAGCGAAEGPPETCEELAARQLSHNAPLAGMLAGSPDTLSRALAEAAGDPVTDGPKDAVDPLSDKPIKRWDTAEGYIERFEDEQGDFQILRWSSKHHYTPIDGSSAASDIVRIFHAIGLSPDAPPVIGHLEPGRLDVSINRLYQGQNLLDPVSGQQPGLLSWEMEESSASDGMRAQVTIAPFFDLADRKPALSLEEASRVAQLAARCLHAAPTDADLSNPTTEFEVIDETLVYSANLGWVVSSSGSCDDSRYVLISVDAMTGAIADPGRPEPRCRY